AGPPLIRAMAEADLAEAASLTNRAFAALPQGEGDEAEGPIFSDLFFRSRWLADPQGCLVAVGAEAPQRLLGVMISVRRGTLGWFGPLAVLPDGQRAGTGQRLVAALVELWQARGVRLMGLETFAESPFHVHLYSKAGFRPSWTGITLERALEGATAVPPGVELGGPVPDLGFIYPGLDLSGEASTVAASGAGVALTAGGGLAILHLEPTFQPPGMGFVPFLAAPDRDSFSKLLGAAEALSRERGLSQLITRVPGSSWATLDALEAMGYRSRGVMLRMKRGETPDYDRTEAYYCDNWL
ncbi:MAG: GNAT family N-acetyltransferase, partial [Candidatus Dormibacteria bacterium]